MKIRNGVLSGMLFLGTTLTGATALADIARPVTMTGSESAQKQRGEIWVNVGGFSRHFAKDKNYNENNHGLGIEYRSSPDSNISYMAGRYFNSVRETTNYAAVNWQPWQIGPVKIGAAVGLMNGYPSIARGGTFFTALPLASINGERFGANLGLIPPMGQINGALLVQLKLRIY